MNWQIWIIFNVLVYSITYPLRKLLFKGNGDNPILYAAVNQVFTAAFLLVPVIILGIGQYNLDGIKLNVLLMIPLYFFMNYFAFKATELIESSEFSIIYASFSIWSVIFSMIFLGESLMLYQFIGVILIVLGILLVFTKEARNIKFNRGHLWTLVSAMFLGLAFINDLKILPRFENPTTYLSISFLFPGLPFVFMSIKNYKHNFKLFKSNFSLLVLLSFFLALASLSISSSYLAGGQAAQIGPIAQVSIVLATIWSMIFLKEKKYAKLKLFAAMVVFLGAVLLSL